MKEFKGNVFNNLSMFDAVCVTSNGFVKKNGACVMGAGIAKTVRDSYPGIDLTLGALIRKHGNRVMRMHRPKGDLHLLSFPVKHNWWEDADPLLIEKSAIELMQVVNKFGYKAVALPRPGCGNGKLNWADVKPILEPILDDRVIICSF